MKIVSEVFVLFQLYVHVIDGIVYAGYNAVTKKEGISSLDRYRCAETYVGFEYIGHVLSPDGVCTGVQYGGPGDVSPASEFLKKTWNCNIFDSSINNNNIFSRYEAPIPGEMVNGSSIEIVFVPLEPWAYLALDLNAATETDIILHTKFRRDGDRIHSNSYVLGHWQNGTDSHGVDITSDSVATLTVEVLSDAFKVSVNGLERIIYPFVLSPSTSRMIHFFDNGGSFLLKSICFKNL